MSTKPEIQYEDFAKLDLRIATIEAAEILAGADRLLKIQVDLGDEKRQICAGIRQYYNPQQLVGQQVVIVANLAPRKMCGEVSDGMMLAASVAPDGEGEQEQDVVVLSPAKAVPNGSVVS